MDLRDDGTITLPFPVMRQGEDGQWEQTGEDETIVLRRPLLTEVFDMWEALDRLGEEMPLPEGDDAAASSVRQMATLRRNAEWTRIAVSTLATTPVYIRETNGDGKEKLRVREGLAEGGWMASAQVAARMLNHWQNVPLAPGASTPT